MREIARGTQVKEYRELAEIFSSIVLQIVKNRQAIASQHAMELYCNFLIELQRSHPLLNHSEWFCHQFNQEFFRYCTNPPPSICQLFADNQTAVNEYNTLLSDFISQLISSGYLSLQQFSKSSFVRIMTSNKPVPLSTLSVFYRKLILLDQTQENSQTASFLPFSSREVIREHLENELHLTPPSIMLQVLCLLFHITKERDNHIFRAISKSAIIQEFSRAVPPSMIRSSMRQSKLASATQVRFAFHSIFFGSIPFLSFEAESSEVSVQQTLKDLLEMMGHCTFELVKLAIDYVFDDWRSSCGSNDSVFFGYVTNQVLVNICEYPDRVEMFGALARSIGKPFENVLLEKLLQLLSLDSILLGQKSIATELESPLATDEEMKDETSLCSNIAEYQLLDAIELLIVSCLPSGQSPDTRSKLLESLRQQIEKWDAQTKNLDICDDDVPLDLLQSHLLLRLRLVRYMLDSIHIEKFPQAAENFVLLLLRLCENTVALYYDCGENLFEYIVRLIELVLDPLYSSEKPQRRDKTKIQFILQFKGKMRVTVIR